MRNEMVAICDPLTIINGRYRYLFTLSMKSVLIPFTSPVTKAITYSG